MNKLKITYCYCDLCKNSLGRLQIIDESNKDVYLRSGRWLLDKLKKED